MIEKNLKSPLILLFSLFSPYIILSAQMITGTWKGKINRQKVEVKLIQRGDSLTGTSYYFESAGNYRRYSIKGHFEEKTNSVVWWDDQLLEEKSTRFSISSPGKMPMLSTADFNCPGGGKMMLDGNAASKENKSEIKGDVHLDKTNIPVFEDEWDYIIDNYTVGTNDPDIIDSVANISMQQEISVVEPETTAPQKEEVVRVSPPPVKTKPEMTTEEKQAPVAEKPVKKMPPLPVIKVAVMEEKFIAREKKLIKEIPVSGDSIELRFYDNAEIDGDSISLFLNNQLLFQHIRLTGNAYILKIAVSELKEINELVMVAENLGSIPPNTSYMIAFVGEQRYDALLASTEGSSAMIRLIRK